MKAFNLVTMKTYKSGISRDNLFNIVTVALSIFSILINWIFALGYVGNVAPFVIFFIFAFMNRVSFKDEKFFNSQGVDISNNLPNMLSNWCSIALLIFILMFFIGVTPFNSFSFVWNNAIGTIFTIIISYFIYKDYPMSILINEQAWEQKLKVFGFKPRMCCCTPYIPKSKPVDLLNDPKYSGFSSNTNNYYHWHRH